MILKQSTTYVRVFRMVQASDHLTPLVGVSPAPVVKISKNGGAGTTATNSPATEIDGTNMPGWYKLSVAIGDTNALGDLIFHATATGADPCDWVDQVQSQVFTDLSMDASGHATIASNVRKNQELVGFTFVMTDSLTHQEKPSLTVTAQRSLGGAGFAPCANAVTEIANGAYAITLAASDLNADVVLLRFTASGADPLDILLLTQP